MAKKTTPAKSKEINPTDSKAKESKVELLNATDSKPAKASDKKNKNKAAKDKKVKDSEIKVQDKVLIWEPLKSQFKPNKQSEDSLRAKVPGGWFVSVSKNKGGGVFFYPDPEYTWDGSSL